MNVAAARAALRPRVEAPSNDNVIPLRSVPPAPDQRPSSPPAPEGGTVAVPVGRWAKYMGTLAAGLTVTAAAAAIRAGGHEPNQPDDADVDHLARALEEGLRMRFGDREAPWWLGAATAAASVYAAMRIGARPRVTALVPDGKPSPEVPAEPPAPKPSHAPAFSVPMPPPVAGNGS